MTHAEYARLETELKAKLARTDRRWFLFHEIIAWAGAMALLVTILDATPWASGHDHPLARLALIIMWSAAMAWWQLTRIRKTIDAQTD